MLISNGKKTAGSNGANLGFGEAEEDDEEFEEKMERLIAELSEKLRTYGGYGREKNDRYTIQNT